MCTKDADQKDVCHEVVELGLIVYALIADAGHGNSLMLHALGKSWKLTIEEVIEKTDGLDLPIWILFFFFIYC